MMKNLIVFAFISFVLFSCSKKSEISAMELTKEIQLKETFIEIENNSSATIHLDESISNDKIVLEGDKILVENLNVDVINNKLKISNIKSLNLDNKKNDSLLIKLNNNSLQKIILAGTGGIYSKNIILKNDVNVYVTGAGNVNLKLQNNVTDVSLAGAGTINLNGESYNLKVSISGAGEINSKQLKSNTCDVVISGAGNVYVNALKHVNANISGVGNLYYKKYDNLLVNEQVSGIGKVVLY